MSKEHITPLELPLTCKCCPRGNFNDFWCVWADTQCYKDRVKEEKRKKTS